MNKAMSNAAGVGKIEDEARIVVDVNAPKGTRASVDANNVFKETRLNRSQQMDHSPDTGFQAFWPDY